MDNKKIRKVLKDAKLHSIANKYAWVIIDNDDIYYTSSDEITQTINNDLIVAEFINGELTTV